jgi:hypothetical protein
MFNRQKDRFSETLRWGYTIYEVQKFLMLHRAKGPAVEAWEGSKRWCFKGSTHRENDLPAVIKSNGDKEWWINGAKHRDYGLPAIEYKNGINEYYENGKQVKFKDEIEIEKTEKFTKHYVNGFLHRYPGPAVEYSNGDKEWFIHGIRYGITCGAKIAPAIKRADGSAEWLENGTYINSDWNSIDANGRKYKYSGTYKNRKMICTVCPDSKITDYNIYKNS